jgi:hypothetical protein
MDRPTNRVSQSARSTIAVTPKKHGRLPQPSSRLINLPACGTDSSARFRFADAEARGKQGTRWDHGQEQPHTN